jgi:hypothetical protein
MKTDFVCKNRAAAIAALDAVAESLPAGTQRQALAAIGAWIEKNTQPMPNWDKTLERLEEFFKGGNNG